MAYERSDLVGQVALECCDNGAVGGHDSGVVRTTEEECAAGVGGEGRLVGRVVWILRRETKLSRKMPSSMGHDVEAMANSVARFPSVGPVISGCAFRRWGPQPKRPRAPALGDGRCTSCI